MEQHSKHDDLQPLNPKKGDKDLKNQEDKQAPRAKLKRRYSTLLETIPENNEWHNLDQMTKRNKRKRHFFEKKGTKTLTKICNTNHMNISEWPKITETLYKLYIYIGTLGIKKMNQPKEQNN